MILETNIKINTDEVSATDFIKANELTIEFTKAIEKIFPDLMEITKRETDVLCIAIHILSEAWKITAKEQDTAP